MFPELVRDDVFRLESRRLWLRWPNVRDAAAIERLAGEREVAEMTGAIPHPYPAGEAEGHVFRMRKDNATGQGWRLALAFKNRPADLIGIIGVNAKGTAAEFGYWLGTPFHGQGLMTEAVGAVIDALVTYADFDSFEAAARVINPASARVLAKLGFRHEGSAMRPAPARGGPVPVDRFRLTRAAWEERAGRLATSPSSERRAVPECCD